MLFRIEFKCTSIILTGTTQNLKYARKRFLRYKEIYVWVHAGISRSYTQIGRRKIKYLYYFILPTF
jgi:hypothetical protein